MRKEKRRKKTLFFTLRGVHDFFSTSLLPKEWEKSIPRELMEIEEVKSGEKRIWCRLISAQVNLPPELQSSRQHPVFVRRLIKEIPGLSKKNGSFRCGEKDDFTEKLLTVDVNLAHIYEHVYAYVLIVLVLARFFDVAHVMEHPIHLRTFEPNAEDEKEVNKTFTLYNIALFYVSQEAIPAEFFGIEQLVCGYLNAKMRNSPFDIIRRTNEFVEHRTEKEVTEEISELPIKKGKIHFLPRKIVGMFRAAMLIFNTS